ncbi:rhodanese-like domain-containing protein [Spongiibacter taiwanensis]|uniref:sulfurtransferase n=1 Tax=Spongiibacter taiwanensis TaxID=1748242 RepID=UPI0020360A59|nr:rhodanese-like domain-containing protein [Spongiibacter taiwanensis]USA42454.1 rhodanese-like domain-containing protein [Spongiibacter taiwanensis]
MKDWPLLIQARDLVTDLDDPNLLIVDVCSQDNFLRHHIPGAVHINPSELQRGEKPAVGKLPEKAALESLFSRIGLTPDSHVVCYDDEGGGWAGRLIWTLDAIDHQLYSYVDGGLHAWLAEGHPVESGEHQASPTRVSVEINTTPIAEIEDFIHLLDNAQLAIWDARSPQEYSGEKVVAARGGHIPGAVNLDWLELMDKNNHLRFKDLNELQQRLNELGITPDKTVITHCQTHHRSGLSYLLMKILGYPNIKGYHGSWGEWGNREDTPIETGEQASSGSANMP